MARNASIVVNLTETELQLLVRVVGLHVAHNVDVGNIFDELTLKIPNFSVLRGKTPEWLKPLQEIKAELTGETGVKILLKE